MSIDLTSVMGGSSLLSLDQNSMQSNSMSSMGSMDLMMSQDQSGTGLSIELNPAQAAGITKSGMEGMLVTKTLDVMNQKKGSGPMMNGIGMSQQDQVSVLNAGLSGNLISKLV